LLKYSTFSASGNRASAVRPYIPPINVTKNLSYLHTAVIILVYTDKKERRNML
jgi:hypothetical protein